VFNVHRLNILFGKITGSRARARGRSTSSYIMKNYEKYKTVGCALGIMAIFSLVQSTLLNCIGVLMALRILFGLRDGGAKPCLWNKMKYILPMLMIILGMIYLVRSLDGEIRDFDVTQYEKAAVVGTLGNSKDKIEISTSSGVNATISSAPINSISIKYQDEEKEREIYHTHLINLAETRQTRDKDIIFIKITGWHMTRLNEEEQEEKIFKYNLLKRKLIGWAKIN